jgi:hypothetical protein
MKDNDPKDTNVTVSVRLAPTDVAALRAEAARKVQAGERFDLSRLVREQLRAAPWYPHSEGDGHAR